MIGEFLGEVEGLIFDAVGTLIEPTPSVAEVYRAVAASRGLAIEVGAMRDCFRSAFGAATCDDGRGPLSTSEDCERRRWRSIVDGCLKGVSDPSAAFESLWEHFGQPSAWRAFPDVGPTLRSLADAGLPIRVGSNFDGRLRPVLRGLPDLAPWADSALISSEVGVRKPHPDFFRAACESLGLPTSRVLYVGDDQVNDLEGARSAGLKSLLLDRSGRSVDRSSTIRSLEDLLDRDFPPDRLIPARPPASLG